MPQILSDDGTVMTVLTDDGRQVEVASAVGRSVLPPDVASMPQEPQDLGQVPEPLAPSFAPPELPGGLGGDVPEVPAITPPAAPFPDPQPAPQVAPAPAPAPGAPAIAPGAPPQPPQAKPGTAPSPAEAPPEVQAPDLFEQGSIGEVRGILGEAAAQRRGFAQQGAIISRNVALDRKLEKERAQGIEKFKAEDDLFKARVEESRKKYYGAEVDPRRVWNNMSTGQEVAAWIGIALSGLGAAFQGRGGENNALEMIDRAINRDVQIQMAGIEKLGQEYAMNRESLADARDMFATDQARIDKMKADRWHMTAREMEAIGAQTSSEVVREQARQRAGEALQRAGIYETDAMRSNRQFRMQQFELGQRARAEDARRDLAEREFGLRERGILNKEKAAKKAADMRARGIDPSLLIANHQGVPIYLADKTVRKPYLQLRSDYLAVDEVLGEYERVLREHGESAGDLSQVLAKKVNTASAIAIRGAFNNAKQAVVKYRAAGANLTQNEERMAHAAVYGNPEEWAMAFSKENILLARENFNGDYNSRASGYTVDPNAYVDFVPKGLGVRRKENAAQEASRKYREFVARFEREYGMSPEQLEWRWQKLEEGGNPQGLTKEQFEADIYTKHQAFLEEQKRRAELEEGNYKRELRGKHPFQ